MYVPNPQTSRLISILHGPRRPINLGTTVIAIGRAPYPYNRLVLDDLQISTYHAAIHPAGERYNIIDRGSRNGTFVNGYRLTPKIPYSLHPNEQIRFGQNTGNPGTTFIYMVTGAEPVVPVDVEPPPPSSRTPGPPSACHPGHHCRSN
jgi:pSer/pThr/pTyr-binding forkhead associated (FHA) protein